LVCIRGFWKRLHPRAPEQPFVKARIFIGEEEIGIVEFLIDTGGGVTLLSRSDAYRLGLTERVNKKKCIETIGIAATEKACEIKGEPRIVLEDSIDSNIKVEAKADKPVFLVPPEPPKPPKDRRYYRYIYARPSVLGWNILKHTKTTINYKDEIIELCINS